MLDLVFMAVAVFATLVGVFLNKYLPTIDVCLLFTPRKSSSTRSRSYALAGQLWVSSVLFPLALHGLFLLIESDLVMMICLSVKAAAGRHTASYAFTHFDPSFSGWTPGWSFFVGLIPVSVIMTCTLHSNTDQLPSTAW